MPVCGQRRLAPADPTAGDNNDVPERCPQVSMVAVACLHSESHEPPALTRWRSSLESLMWYG